MGVDDSTRIVGQRSTDTEPSDVESGSTLTVGESVDRYVVLGVLGSGGMGDVYVAYDPELDRKVALKFLKFETGQVSDGVRTRLLREAQALARLSHPNVVAVYDVGEYEGQIFVAMEYVEGETLQQWLREQPRSWRDSVTVLLEAGTGLQAAHAAGIVHRDFKPSNVMVGSDGRVRVLDFGLARAAGSADEGDDEQRPDDPSPEADPTPLLGTASDSLMDPLTHAGVVMGTPGYMAPEQLLAEQVDARTDQFGFFVTLYEALYGVRPFVGGSPQEVSRAVLRGRIGEPPKTGGAPRAVWAAITRGLRVDPAQRFGSMAEALDALRSAMKVRRRLAIAAIATAVAVGGVGLAWRGGSTNVEICEGATEQFAAVWNDERKTELAAAFDRTGKSFAQDSWSRAASIIDRYGGDWAGMRTAACRATRVTGEQSAELMDLRMACLDRELRGVEALAGVFAQADAEVVTRAVTSAQSLPPVAQCADVDLLRAPIPPPTNPQRRAEIERLRGEVVALETLAIAGRIREGLPRARTLLESAKKQDYAPLTAEASLRLGDFLTHAGQAEEARQMYDQALWAAAESGHGSVEARALVGLVIVTGFHLSELDQGRRYGRHARAVISRLGSPPHFATQLAAYEGNVHFRAGNLDDAREAFERAIERGGDDPRSQPSVRAALTNLGAVLGTHGEHEAALAAFQEALRRTEEALGPGHPSLATILNNIGVSSLRLGRLQQAEAATMRAKELWTATLGPRHPEIAKALHNLGAIHGQRGDHERGLKWSIEALEIKRAAQGDVHPSVALSLNNVADALVQLRRFEEAKTYLDDAVAAWEGSVGMQHPDAAWTLTNIGEVRMGLGRPEDAIEPLETALRMLTEAERDPIQLGRVELQLARVLSAAGRQPQRVKTLTTTAESRFRLIGDGAKKDLDELLAFREQGR